MLRKIKITTIAIVVLLCFSLNTAFALSITARGGFVLNVNTGDELFSKDPDTRYSLASMTKLLSVYVVMDQIKSGNLSMDTQVIISKNVHNYSRVSTISNIALTSGAAYTVNELLDSVLVASACGSVVALAEHICGSEAAFVNLMNEKIKALGLNAGFANSTGTVSSNVISARSMALLAGSLVKTHPEILLKTSQKSITFRGGRYNSTNKLLSSYAGVDGLKTGTSSAAGTCFTATAERNGIRLVTVVLNSADRFSDTVKLLDYGFSNPGDGSNPAGGIKTEEEGIGYATPLETKTEAASENPYDKISIIINGLQIPFYDIDPVKIDGCVYVPIRVISSALMAKISWSENNKANISKGDTEISIEVGKSEIIKNDEAIEINGTPFVKDGFLLVPIRAVSEGFSANVEWNSEYNQVIISD